MAASRLGLFDLIVPQYLAGIQLPAQVHQYLAALAVENFDCVYTDGFVMYSGFASFRDPLNAQAIQDQTNGSGFSWDEKNFHFRMIIPRNGAEFIDRSANDFDPTDGDDDGKLPGVSALLNDLRPQPDADMDTLPLTVDDFPAVAFRLELLIDILNFSLGDDWKPGMINSADNRIKIDPAHASEKVKIRLPKVLISYTQTDDANNLNPTFKVESWGMAGFDAPQDLSMGELIRMEPSIAVHRSEHIAFSIDRVILDASKNATPPEILEHFGVDEEWEGLYIKQALIYYNNDQGVGFNFRVKDALISFAGEVTFEAALDIYLNSTLGLLTAVPSFYNGADAVAGLIRGVIDDPPVAAAPAGNPEGSVTIRQGAVMHLQISGGMPPYIVQVMQAAVNLWDNATRRATFNTVGTGNVFISVTDASTGVGSPLRSSEYLQVTVEAAPEAAPANGTPADRPPSTDALQPINPFNITGNDATHELTITENSETVTLEIRGPEPFTVAVTGGTSPLNYSNQRSIPLNVPNNTNLAVALQFPVVPSGPLSTTPEILFSYNKPANATDVANYIAGTQSDSIFQSSYTQFDGNHPDAATVSGIRLDGWASFDPSGANRDNALSQLRINAVKGKLQGLYPGITPAENPHGHSSLPNSSEPFDPNNPNHTNDENRLVRITFTSAGSAAVNITATISRPAAPAIPPSPGQPPAVTGNPPAAPNMPNDIPPVLKQLGIRVKVERNQLSLLELYGKIDFETAMETEMRQQRDTHAPRTGSEPEGNLNLQHGNANDGLIDFKVTYQYDQATSETTLIFMLHSDERDTDGLLHMDNNANRDDRFKNIFGALLLFAPIINSSVEAVGNNTDDPGAWMALGASLVVPIAIGGLNVFRTRRIILYGGEARTRWVTPAPGEPLRSLDIGLVFDYEVQFDIICDELGIGRNRLPGAPAPLPPPLRARYKAIGFNVNYTDTPAYKGLSYHPVFDASRGYDLDLSDPSLFQLPPPLSNLFNIAGARLARFNPVTLEIDFAIKVDLGVITVDRFKLKIPLDPPGIPQIIPSGVRVNIPGVLTGNGFVEIVETEIANEDGTTTTAKGIEGGLDLTLVSLKIRIAANLGVGTIKDDSGREAVSVFLSMVVQFPTPLILGATGLGIYGFMGLFAMHYKRLEAPADPTKAVGPALNWLIKANGEPTRLRTKPGDTTAEAMAPAGPHLWQMAFDRWSFGIGVLMGTAEGGFLVNMQGMFVLELPGPRILIMVKVKMVTVLPSDPPDPARSLEVGIIGIIDIDFARKQLTLGVMINFSIEQVLAITLPIELFFKWDDPGNWHLYLGTIAQPASATILDIVRGSAYLMIQGNTLRYQDYGTRVPEFMRNKVLPGVAIAIGLEASITLGDESIDIYLRIAAGAHLGVSFSPFLVVGSMYFSGELRLIIISISARGSFDVLVSKRPNSDDLKVYMHGKVCGSIDFFFFEISACVELSIGDENYDVTAPPLIRGVYLQSFSPVLVSGQGSTKPIDASLGAAHDMADGAVPSDILTVPIDSIPVIQLQATPALAPGFEAASFVTTPAGTISGTAGKTRLSDEVEVEYILNSVTLTENGAAYNSGSGKPPSVWRIDRPNNASGTDNSIDLATFSRTPATASYAVERSTELNTNVQVRWENACKQPAPPSPVLFTFCGQALGISNNGWTLHGTPKPDPEGTVRTQPVYTTMRVYQPGLTGQFSSLNMVLDYGGFEVCNPSKVVGIEDLNVSIPETRERKCFNLKAEKTSYQKNPLLLEEELNIYSAEDKRSFFTAGKGFIYHTDLKPFESPYRTHYRSINKTVGLSIREYMRIDFLKDPVSVVYIRFISFNTKAKEKPRLAAAAYNAAAQKLDEKIFTDASDKVEVDTIMLQGEDIKHIIIRNRNFTGVFVEICYERIRKPNLQVMTDYLRCVRSLQLPYCRLENKEQQRLAELLNKDQLKEYFDKRDSCCALLFETGACESLLFYGALHLKYYYPVMVQELDNDNNLIKEYKLEELIEHDVNNLLTDLPADWLNAGLPWRPSVIPVATYLQSGFFNGYRRIMFRLKPSSEKTVRVKFCTCGAKLGVPVLYISAIEALQLSEVQHNANVSEMLTTEQKTLGGYLNDNTPIPLLKPGCSYSMAVSYTANIYTRKKPTDSFTLSNTENKTQTFAFATDTTPPLPLSPYVLGTAPVMDEHFHFFRDPLKVVFNDKAFLRMYQAYGKQLKAIIRGADGAAVGQSPEIINTMQDIPAQVKTPYREAIERLIALGLLPCAGTADFPTQPVYTPLFDLKPLMPYTFDIEFDPADAVPAGEPLKPLFRRAFTTSRYAGLEDFVKDMQFQALRHKALKAIIAGVPAAVPGPEPSVHTINDTAFEDALLSAGVAQDAAKEKSGFTLLWSNNSGDFVPYALLIDASEPMWRTNIIAQTRQVLNEQMQVIDPNFKIYENQEADAMVLKRKGTENLISHFVKTSGGTRTLVMLKTVAWPAAGTPFTVQVAQLASAFYGLPLKQLDLVNLTLYPKAPWED